MKLVEAMKKLQIITKRMDSNTKDINRYSSIMSNERPEFGSEEEQKKEVAGLVQANKDLMEQYLTLKKQIERTNLETEVDVDGETRTISEWLVIRRKMAKMMEATYIALNDNTARGRMAYNSGDKMPQVVKMFDEKVRLEGLNKWQTMADEIDGRLQVINGLTDIVE